MKNLWALFAIFFVFALPMGDAEAKRFGGGKSFGQSYRTAPAQPKPTADNTRQQQTTPAQNNNRKGMLGGLMGGLLAGGLIAALFGGAFEGIQLMDILLIALVAFLIFKFMRRGRASHAPAYAGSAPPFQHHQQNEPMARVNTNQSSAPSMGSGSTGFASGSDEVPFKLPAGFDLTAFLQGAREHYRTLQEAWNKNDLAMIQEYVTPELYNDLREERATLEGDQHTEVLFVDAELVRADQMFGKSEVSVKFTGRYRDTVEGVEEPITDIWHLQRDLSQADAPWYIVGIES